MASKVKVVRKLLGETVSNWRDDKAPRLAAALAYYATFSIAPFLILVILIAGFVMRDSQPVRNKVVAQVEAAAGQQAAESVATLIDNASVGKSGALAGAISFAVLLVGTTGAFGQLRESLNTIWRVEAKDRRGFWSRLRNVFLSLTVVAGTSFLLLVSLVLSAAIPFVSASFGAALGGHTAIFGLVNALISLAVVSLVFVAVFKVVPDADVAWNDVWPGALVTALLFTVGKELLGLYLGRSSFLSLYGAAGSLVVFLAWVYYSAQVFFFGAEFTQVYARRRSSGRRRQPDSVEGHENGVR